MKMHRGAFVLFFAAMLGFSAQALESGEAEATREGAATANLAYYIVTHVDKRKCVSPLCGGWFVKRVNRKLTRCADGNWRRECHVFDLDVSAIGLGEEMEQKVEFLWGASHALVRGSISQGDGGLAYPIDTLKATEAWAGVAESKPRGSFYGVTDSGIVCITYPCPSFTEAKLNTLQSANIHGVELAASGATDQEVQDGFAELAESGIPSSRASTRPSRAPPATARRSSRASSTAECCPHRAAIQCSSAAKRSPVSMGSSIPRRADPRTATNPSGLALTRRAARTPAARGSFVATRAAGSARPRAAHASRSSATPPSDPHRVD
ncbi:MAG: DUF6748 domain-containing protein [Burkholderiales bacterium]